MRAVVIREHGGYDKLLLEDRPVPEPGPKEIRVRVHAAGLNHLDTWVRRGVPGHTFPLPMVPGCDGAGVVDALGPGVDGPEVGTRVLVAWKNEPQAIAAATSADTVRSVNRIILGTPVSSSADALARYRVGGRVRCS